MDSGEWVLTVIAVMVLGCFGLLVLIYGMLLLVLLPKMLKFCLACFLLGLPLYAVLTWGWAGWLGVLPCWPLAFKLFHAVLGSDGEPINGSDEI